MYIKEHFNFYIHNIHTNGTKNKYTNVPQQLELYMCSFMSQQYVEGVQIWKKSLMFPSNVWDIFFQFKEQRQKIDWLILPAGQPIGVILCEEVSESCSMYIHNYSCLVISYEFFFCTQSNQIRIILEQIYLTCR